MKKLSIIAAGFAIMLSSCATVSKDTKDIKHMQIRFKPLSRNDMTLVGNLQAEATITGKMSRNGYALDKTFAQNYKTGKVTSYETTEMLYFAPGQGEVITGSLYENDIFNLVYTPSNAKVVTPGFFKMLFGGGKSRQQQVKRDDGMNFAYYAMVEKYPEIDYFINVRFDRKISQK